MKEDIRNRNNKGQHHGYQKYYEVGGKIWLRSNYKNSEPIGYHESNPDYGGIGDKGTIVEFNIR